MPPRVNTPNRKRQAKPFGPSPEHPKISYVRTHPYGAPKVRLFGQTFHVKNFIKDAGFRWVKDIKAWEGYFNPTELVAILADLIELHGCEVVPAKTNKPDCDLTDAINEEIKYRNED